MKKVITVSALALVVAYGGYALSSMAGLFDTPAAILIPSSSFKPKPATSDSVEQIVLKHNSRKGAIADDSTITLTWKDRTDNEKGFEIHRSTTHNFTPGTIVIKKVGENVTTFKDTEVIPGVIYYYKVRAVLSSDSALFTSFSNNASTWVRN